MLSYRSAGDLARRFSIQAALLATLLSASQRAQAQGAGGAGADPCPKPAQPTKDAVPPPSAPGSGEARPVSDAAPPADEQGGAAPSSVAPSPAASSAPPPPEASRASEPPTAAAPAEPARVSAPTPPPSPPDVPPAVPAPPGSVRGGERWYDDLHMGAFVDGYFALNSNFPKPQGDTTRLRAFDRNNGFALSWVGLGAAYEAHPVGFAVDLRVGPSSEELAGDDANHGLEFVKQAYVTFVPDVLDRALSLDFGKFDGPFGVEVADSQANLNYTRGFLYTLGRPRFLTGLRGTYRVIEPLSVSLMVVGGWDRTIDNNAGKDLGLQATYATEGDPDSSLLVLSLGYLVGPEQSDIGTQPCPAGLMFDRAASACTPSGSDGDSFPVDRGTSNTEALRHLVDAVAIARPVESLELQLNGNFGADRMGTDGPRGRTFTSVSWYGARLAGRYTFDETWAAALRGEYYGDGDAFTCGAVCADEGVGEMSLVSVTATAEVRPARNFAVKLDGRWDHAELTLSPGAAPGPTGPGIFPVLRTSEPDQVTITLGFVASSDAL